jgi:hypothetical protein
VASEHVNYLRFELLLLPGLSVAETVTRDDLCTRMRCRTTAVSEAIHIDHNAAALILRAVQSLERRRDAPAPLIELRHYASRLLNQS